MIRKNPSDANWFPSAKGVTKLSSCVLKVGNRAWSFAQENEAAIAARWAEKKQSNPRYFNGAVHLVDDVRLNGGALDASLLRTDFKSYLHWREQGFPEAGVRDGFGSALIRTSEGHVMLGRQRSGNVNAGLAYSPAGFIDAQDVDADGFIHIAQSALREATEETGIDGEALVRDEGFYLVRSGAQLAIVVPFRTPMSTAEFMRRAEKHIAASPDSELDAIIPVTALRDVENLAMLPYMRTLLEAIFAGA
jgi:8-oxo-dGTP pyrophosphatase MutT (NUDIX family)